MGAVKKYTKKEAVAIAIKGAKLYRDNFVGKNLLFILTDKHKRVSKLEVEFTASNYMHLTGLRTRDSSWTSGAFYDYCEDGRLRESDIEFSKDGSTHQKLAVLLDALRNPNLSASMAGEYNSSRPYLYTERLAGGVRWAMGFRLVDGTKYLPDTLLEGDVRELLKQQYRVVATYRKAKSNDEYEECVYKARKVDWERLSYPDDWGNLPKPGPEGSEKALKDEG